MTATYCVEGRWYYIQDATICADEHGRVKEPRLWTGWIYVREKKYHTDSTVTLIGSTPARQENPNTGERPVDSTRVILEMRRGLTVKTLKDGPPAYIIQEQTLV